MLEAAQTGDATLTLTSAWDAGETAVFAILCSVASPCLYRIMQKEKKKKKIQHKSQEIKIAALHYKFVNINLQIFCKKQGNYYLEERF